MQRMLSTVLIVACLAGARSAAAQSPAASNATGPTDTSWFIGVTAGAGSVHKAAGLVGGQLGYRVSDRIEIFGEGLGLLNVVNNDRLDLVRRVGAFLQASQGGTVSSTIKAPAFYAGGGLHLMLTGVQRVRPFVSVGAGVARVTLQPAFTLGGADVTASLPQYGVTLGSDLTGSLTKPAFAGGVGVRIAQGRWGIDADVGVISIRTAGSPTNVLRTSAGLGFGF
jgi:hypothetical protein